MREPRNIVETDTGPANADPVESAPAASPPTWPTRRRTLDAVRAVDGVTSLRERWLAVQAAAQGPSAPAPSPLKVRPRRGDRVRKDRPQPGGDSFEGGSPRPRK